MIYVALFRARHITLKVAGSITITSASTLPSIFDTASPVSITQAKDVTIVEPEIEVDKVDQLGVDANSFQNAQLESKPAGLGEISGTLVHDGDEVLEPYFYGPSSIAGPSGYTRHQVGQGSRNTCAFLAFVADGTKQVAFVLDSALITKLGEAKLSADGHMEQPFKAVCLTKNFYKEFKN